MKSCQLEDNEVRVRRKTYVYVDTLKGLKQARTEIKEYLRQSYVDEHGRSEPARLALDVETYHKFPQVIPAAVPRAIWMGDHWDGYISLIQFGFDLSNSLKIRDKQFVIDVIALGEEVVEAAVKDILETAILISHNATYELSFIKAHLHSEPESIIDTMTCSQVARGGESASHDLASCYASYLSGKGVFVGLSGKTFKEYKKFKKRMQKTDWSIRPLSPDQLQYAADDVRLIFPVFEAICDRLDYHVQRYERDFPDGKSIEVVLGDVEIPLRPFFTSLEQDGIRFDVPYYRDTVLPLMRRMLNQTAAELAKYPAFQPGGEDNNHIVFSASKEVCAQKIEVKQRKRIKGKMQDVLVEMPALAVHGRELKQYYRRTFPGVKFSVTQKELSSGAREIRIVWAAKKFPTLRDIISVSSIYLSESRGYSYKDEQTINLNSKPAVKKALSKIIGKTVIKCEEDYLRKMINEKKPKTEVIEKYLRWMSCQTIYSRYGEGFMRFVSPIGFVHSQYQQIGREDSEMATGRSSDNNPNLMFTPARDEFYSWDEEAKIGSSELIRSAFIPEEGCGFWDKDLSNIEPRCMAEVTRDKNLIKVFNQDLDMHRLSGAKFFRKAYEDVTDAEREMAKTANLGKTYQMGWRLLREHCRKGTNGAWYPTEREAKQLDNEYDELYPGIRLHAEKIERIVCRRLIKARSLAPFLARNNGGERKPFGHVVDELGRPRFFFVPAHYEDEIKYPDDVLAESYSEDGEQFSWNAYRQVKNKTRLAAHNMRIQGTCAEILKIAELTVWREIRKRGWDTRKNRIVLILHDELLLQCEERYRVEAGAMLDEAMLSAARLFIKVVPVKIDGSWGYSWHAAKQKQKKIIVPLCDEMSSLLRCA